VNPISLDLSVHAYGRKANLVDGLTKALENNKYMEFCKMVSEMGFTTKAGGSEEEGIAP
jgi:hypothetical protein